MDAFMDIFALRSRTPEWMPDPGAEYVFEKEEEEENDDDRFQ
jgi:hypothetical protein